MKIDEAFEQVGNFGRYHQILYAVVFVAGIPNAFILFHTYYSNYENLLHCSLPDELQSIKANNLSQYESFLNQFIPMEVDSHGNRVRSKCRMYERNYTFVENEVWFSPNATELTEKECEHGYTFELEDDGFTTVSEYSMVCGDSWKSPLVASLIQVGIALGAFTGTLADRFGRRTIFIFASIAQILLTLVLSFTWNYFSYAVIMLLAGCSQFANFVAAFVMASEVTAVRWRNFFAISPHISFTLGIMMEAALGYLLVKWRPMLQAASVISACIYLPCFWLLPESARWQIAKGRINKGKKEIKRMAKMNKSTFDTEKFFREYKSEADVEKRDSLFCETFKVFFMSEISPRILSVFFAWCAAGLVYFGIALFSTDFSEDRHLNLIFGGLAEIPALVAGYYSVEMIGRPRTAFFFLSICGITSIALPFMSASVLRTVVAMLGKGAAAVTFYTVYFVAAEVAPTLHRSTTMSIASLCARMGAIVVPFLMHTRKYYGFLPNIVLGSTAILSGLLFIFFIPETQGVPLPDTVDEAARNKRFYGFRIFRSLAPKQKRKFKDNELVEM